MFLLRETISALRFMCPSCSQTATPTVMAAAARFFLRGSNSKLPLLCAGSGGHSSVGASLLKVSPSCSSRTKTQRRHAAHFTYQPDPVPTNHGEGLAASRLTLSTVEVSELCRAGSFGSLSIMKARDSAALWTYCGLMTELYLRCLHEVVEPE